MTLFGRKLLAGTPYIGWSAGSNVACPTIRTTNDMPVVEPDSFECLQSYSIPDKSALSRCKSGKDMPAKQENRGLRNLLKLNPDIYVAGLREGRMLIREEEKVYFFRSRNSTDLQERHDSS